MNRPADPIETLHEVCRRAVLDGEAPGGVVFIGQGDETVARFAFGYRSVYPEKERATVDTIYDLASLTKPIVTATLIMQAVEEGLVNLKEPIGRWLPIPRGNSAADLTPIHLLLHTGGLPAGRSLPAGPATRRIVVEAMTREGILYPAGTRFIYSDVGFHLLGALVETLYGKSLDELARSRIFDPLGMSETGFGVPPAHFDRIAPTEIVEGTCLCGVPHDPAARQMGGIAGHAGLFGTADDLARYCRMILHRGELRGNRVMQPGTVDRMIAPTEVPGGKRRALGWDVDTQYSSPRGDILPARGIGHTGFTGTSCWIDPPTGLFLIILTNRVHPDGDGDVVRLRRLVANVASAAVLP